MAVLQSMPPVVLPTARLKDLGSHWNAAEFELPKKYGQALGSLCDEVVGDCLAKMLGNIPVVKPTRSTARSPMLLPRQADCVEVGPAMVIGGIRPQNFDVAYRPDGVRFAFDSKTLNRRNSLSKNYQNMINDLGTEAASVHTRFPSAIVTFMVAVPGPCLAAHRINLTATLIRLGERRSITGDAHKAEVISLVVWDPATGTIDANWPSGGSPLRIERFSEQVEKCYVDRFAWLPPHNVEES